MQKQTKIIVVIVDYLFQKFLRLLHLFFTVIYFGRKKIVPKAQDPLLLKSATRLAEDIRKSKIKSEDVINAYIKRIREIEPYINATIERSFEDSLAKARVVDAIVASGKFTEEQLATDRPLLGVPVSIKSLLPVKGFRSTACSKVHKDVLASETTPSVSLLQTAGAIVIAITNTPEFGLNFETNNILFGRTSNPYDTTKTSGGSSGGESALIGAAGSVIGLGNDLLGSVRMPSHFTGIFAHKPSRDLVPNDCFPQPSSKLRHFVSTGPMCRYAEDLITTMRVLSSQSETKLKFGKKVNFSKIKVYYLLELYDSLAAPVDEEIKQGLQKAVTHFETTYGTTTKQAGLPPIRNAFNLSNHMLLSSLSDIKNVLTSGKGYSINEKWDLVKYFFGKSIFSLNTLFVLNFSRLSFIYKEKLVPHYQKKLEVMTKEFEALLDDESVLLMPTFPVSAPYHNEITAMVPSCGYTSLFNCLGLPATQCPLGFDKDGLPYGIQIIGKMNNDPLTIACAIELEKTFGGWISPGN